MPHPFMFFVYGGILGTFAAAELTPEGRNESPHTRARREQIGESNEVTGAKKFSPHFAGHFREFATLVSD